MDDSTRRLLATGGRHEPPPSVRRPRRDAAHDGAHDGRHGGLAMFNKLTWSVLWTWDARQTALAGHAFFVPELLVGAWLVGARRPHWTELDAEA